MNSTVFDNPTWTFSEPKKKIGGKKRKNNRKKTFGKNKKK